MRHLCLVILASLAACAESNPDHQDANAAETPPNAAVAGQSSGNAAEPETASPDSDPRDAQAAAVVLRRYFALVDAGRHDQAADLWWDEDRAAAFAERLRGFGDFEPNIAAPQRPEGAAGSVYVAISLQLLRDTSSGLETLSDGSAVLRRVNAIPGSTTEQREWRIDRITLQPPPAPLPASYRFVGQWASNARNCEGRAWRFTADKLTTPAGSVCNFNRVSEVPGGYDIAAVCTAEGPPTDDTLELRFAQSARALLFESTVIADAGLVRCD